MAIPFATVVTEVTIATSSTVSTGSPTTFRSGRISATASNGGSITCTAWRVGRLAGVRYFGKNDWYLLVAEELVHEQHKLGGFWTGPHNEADKVLATSIAILFLAKGRARY